MKKVTTISIAALCLLTACNNGGSSGPSAPAKTQEQLLTEAALVGVADVTQSIKPNSYQVIKSDLTFEEKAERYTIGCKKPGSYESAQQFDKQLKPGTVFLRETGSHEILETLNHSRYEYTAKTVSEQKITFGHNFDFVAKNMMGPFTSMDQIFASKPHAIYTIEFKPNEQGTMTPDVSMSDYQWTQAALNFISTLQGTSDDTYTSCDYDMSNNQQGSKSAWTESKISYMINGKPVPAHLSSYVVENASIYCERKKYGQSGSASSTADRVQMGKGRYEQLSISTNEVVSMMGYIPCGGDLVYNSNKIVLANGKVIQAHAQKTVLAPSR